MSEVSRPHWSRWSLGLELPTFSSPFSHQASGHFYTPQPDNTEHGSSLAFLNLSVLLCQMGPHYPDSPEA